MKLKPFAELIKLSKDALNEALAPIRAHKVKTQASLEVAKIDEELVTIESEIQEMCAKTDLNFQNLLSKLDRFAILERRKRQYGEIIEQLFPNS